MKTIKAFLARDLDGNLCIYFNGKLRKHIDTWIIDLTKSNGRVNCAYLDKDLFPEVTWEDEEPTEVEIKIVDSSQKQAQAKFDPKTLKPFDKVLVRNFIISKWRCEHFSYFDNGNPGPYMTSTSYTFCIPYNEDTKHLVGTTKEAPEFYKYWEN